MQAIQSLASKHMKCGSQMKICSNITSSERNAIKSLQVKAEKREIMVVKADKGRATKLESEQSYI